MKTQNLVCLMFDKPEQKEKSVRILFSSLENFMCFYLVTTNRTFYQILCWCFLVGLLLLKQKNIFPMTSSKQVSHLCVMFWCLPGGAENNLSLNSSTLRLASLGGYQLLRTTRHCWCWGKENMLPCQRCGAQHGHVSPTPWSNISIMSMLHFIF